MTKKKPKFMRTGYTQYSKLGLRRKNKQKYRRSKGGENKIRLKMKGHLTNVSIGYRGNKKTRNSIKGLYPVMISSENDFKKLKKDNIGIVAKIGRRKKMLIAEYAIKNKIKLMNLNPEKFLAKIEEDKKKKKEEKEKTETKKKERDKKAKETEKKKAEEEKKSEKKQDSEKLEDAVKNIETDIKENVEDKK